MPSLGLVQVTHNPNNHKSRRCKLKDISGRLGMQRQRPLPHPFTTTRILLLRLMVEEELFEATRANRLDFDHDLH